MNKKQEEIYHEGYTAACDELGEEANPYTGIDAEYWADGYEDALEDFGQIED